MRIEPALELASWDQNAPAEPHDAQRRDDVLVQVVTAHAKRRCRLDRAERHPRYPLRRAWVVCDACRLTSRHRLRNGSGRPFAAPRVRRIHQREIAAQLEVGRRLSCDVGTLSVASYFLQGVLFFRASVIVQRERTMWLMGTDGSR